MQTNLKYPKTFKLLQRIPVFSGILAMAALLLPVFSGNVIGNLCSAEILINGYNLAEYSMYGFFIILVPMILLNIHYSKLSFERRFLAVITVWIGYLISWGLGILAGKEWLTTLESDIPITYYSIDMYCGQWMIPAVVLVEIVSMLICTLTQMQPKYKSAQI